MKEIDHQSQVVAVAILYIKRAARNGVISIGDTRAGSIFARNLKHIRPVNRPDFRVGIMSRQSTLIQSVAYSKTQHFPGLALLRFEKLCEDFSRHGHEWRHAACKFDPNRILWLHGMLL